MEKVSSKAIKEIGFFLSKKQKKERKKKKKKITYRSKELS